MKRVIFLICVLLLALGVSASAMEYTYDIVNNEAVITGYTGEETEIIVPDMIDGYAVTTIGKAAFKLSNATRIVLPDSVTKIDESAFHLCKSLKEVVLPTNITEIPDSAFLGCYELRMLEIPVSVTRIGSMAFGSTAIEEINLPDCISEIGSDAFWNCDKLTRISIPKSVSVIEKNTFANCKSLEEVIIPETVTHIKHGAFTESGIKKIVIPKNVSVIEGCTFQKCKSLEEVVLPEGLTTIPGSFCYGCESLKKVNISQSVTKIGEAAFQHCTSLEEIILPETVTDISARAFGNCAGLKELNIPDSLTMIGNQTFSGLTSIKEIIIPEGVEVIAEWAFGGCENVERVVIPETVTSIGVQAFANNSKMTEIKLPESLKKIKSGAFMNNTALKEVYIPKNVENMGMRIFEGCSSLEKISVSDENEFFIELGGIVYNMALTEMLIVTPSVTGVVTIPETVTSIPESMFKGTKFKKVIMPDGIASIGNGAFADCSELEEVVIPDRVEKINPHTFTNAKKLKKVVIGEAVSEIGSEAFYNCEIENIVFKSKDTKITRTYWYTEGGNNSSYTLPAFESFYNTSIGTIYGIEGSDAEAYANEKGIKFENATDGYEECKVVVYENEAWVWGGEFGQTPQKKAENVKAACIARYPGSYQAAIVVLTNDNYVYEIWGNKTTSIIGDVHAIKMLGNVVYMMQTDGTVYERIYSNAGAKNTLSDNKEVFEKLPLTVYVNGKPVVTDSEPYIKDDRTMVPMRAIFEALGAAVDWNHSEKTATGERMGIEISIKIGEKVLYKNGKPIELDCAAEIKNDRTMVPVRAISEAFGCDVEWDNVRNSVLITYVDYESDKAVAAERDAICYKYFYEDVKDATAYFQVIDKSVENEDFVLTVKEVLGNAEYMYITMTLAAKDKEDEVFLRPNGVYGQVSFDIETKGAIAKNVWCIKRYGWQEDENAKVFLYRIRSNNYGVVEAVKVNSSVMLGEDMYFELNKEREKIQLELAMQNYEGGYMIIEPIRIVLTYGGIADHAEVFFKFKDGSVKTINQLTAYSSYGRVISEPGEAVKVYEYTYATVEILNLDEIESIIVKGIEYSVDNSGVYKKAEDIPQSLKPFMVNVKKVDNGYGEECEVMSLKELTERTGGEYKSISNFAAEAKIWGKIYRIEKGSKKFYVDGKPGSHVFHEEPQMDENNVMWVEFYSFINTALDVRFDKISETEYKIIP